MTEPHYLALIIIGSLYIISEVLLFFVPKYPWLRYLPSIAGMLTSFIIGYLTYTNFTTFAEEIDRIFFVIVLLGLSIILSVVMSLRKPWKRRMKGMKAANNKDDEVEDFAVNKKTMDSQKVETDGEEEIVEEIAVNEGDTEVANKEDDLKVEPMRSKRHQKQTT